MVKMWMSDGAKKLVPIIVQNWKRFADSETKFKFKEISTAKDLLVERHRKLRKDSCKRVLKVLTETRVRRLAQWCFVGFQEELCERREERLHEELTRRHENFMLIMQAQVAQASGDEEASKAFAAEQTARMEAAYEAVRVAETQRDDARQAEVEMGEMKKEAEHRTEVALGEKAQALEEKHQAEVSAEPEALLQTTGSKAGVFRSCLKEKASCGLWTEQRKKETLACLTESIVKPAAAPPSFVQTGECPDTVDLCQKRVPIGAMESGLTMEQCAETCMSEFCGCPAS